MVKELVKKKKKKKWFSILAPKLFNNALIGETFVEDPNLVVGRKLTANLSNFTGNIRHQSINLKFEVTGIENNAAKTQVLSFETSPASIKRLVRRGTNRVDDSYTAETSDKSLVRIKILMLTRHKTHGLILKTLRAELRKSLVNEIKKTTYENLIKALVAHSLQRDMMTKLKKIYPIRSLEIKRLDLEKGEKERTEKGEVEGEVKEEPKEEIKETAGEIKKEVEVKKEEKIKKEEEPEKEIKEEIKKETKKKTEEKVKEEIKEKETKEKEKEKTKQETKTKKISKAKAQEKENK